MLLEQEQDMSMEGAESRGDLAVMATIIGSFWIRYMRRTCELFDHDLTMAYILGEIGVHNVSHMHAKPSICQSLPQHLSAGTLSSFLKPCMPIRLPRPPACRGKPCVARLCAWRSWDG